MTFPLEQIKQSLKLHKTEALEPENAEMGVKILNHKFNCHGIKLRLKITSKRKYALGIQGTFPLKPGDKHRVLGRTKKQYVLSFGFSALYRQHLFKACENVLELQALLNSNEFSWRKLEEEAGVSIDSHLLRKKREEAINERLKTCSDTEFQDLYYMTMCHHRVSCLPSESGIYAIVLDSGTYIGESINIRKRMIAHVARLKSHSHANKYLIDAFHKSKSVEFIVLELCKKNILKEKEAFWISKLQPNLNILTHERDIREFNEYFSTEYYAKRGKLKIV